jgi:hypothetical protein
MRSLVLLTAILLAGSTAKAQTAGAVGFPLPGTRVRIANTAQDTIAGVVTRRSLDSLWLEDRPFSRSEILSLSTLERNRGKGAKRGFLIGGGIGLVALGAGAVADATAPPCRGFVCIPAVAVAGVFAVLSTGIGTLVGTGLAPREWRPAR